MKLWVHAVFFGSVQPTKIILLLLDELNAIVRYMREHPEPVQVHFRMADFASFALKVGTLWDCREEIENEFVNLEAAQSGCALEDDPIHQVLELWLRNEANHSRDLDAGTLHQEWTISRFIF